MRLFRWLMATLLFLLGLPVLGVVVTALLANALGCTVSEAEVHPCHLAGISIGHVLYDLGVLGWLMIVTVPLAGVVALTWLAIEAIRAQRGRKASD